MESHEYATRRQQNMAKVLELEQRLEFIKGQLTGPDNRYAHAVAGHDPTGPLVDELADVIKACMAYDNEVMRAVGRMATIGIAHVQIGLLRQELGMESGGAA
jgi:hypothetical protein